MARTAKRAKQAPSSFSDGLRQRLRARLLELAADDPQGRKGGEGPRAAKEIGVAYSTLWRFLWRSKGLSAGATDKVVAWLDKGAS